MKLQEQIKQDLTAAMKAKDEKKKSALRVVLGEFSRLDKKELIDDDVVKILKKLIKAEKEVIQKKGEQAEDEFVKIVEHYLPKMATEAEIRSWIEQNIDFANFKNKMQAMGQIMQHFGTTTDGNAVKEILQQM
jgi:uncharacterized protein YqeY